MGAGRPIAPVAWFCTSSGVLGGQVRLYRGLPIAAIIPRLRWQKRQLPWAGRCFRFRRVRRQTLHVCRRTMPTSSQRAVLLA